MSVPDQPTVMKVRAQGIRPEESKPLNAAELKELALRCGADDAGLVEIERPALDDQRDYIRQVFAPTRTLLSFVVRLNREPVRSPAQGQDHSDPTKARGRAMNPPQITQETISVVHVTIASVKPFDEVKGALELLVPRLNEGVFKLLRDGKGEQALCELEGGPALSIFGFRDHGALLQIAGLKRKAIQYDIGNPLTASKMTRYQLSAALYAPVRVLLRESAEGGAAFEYDRPRTTFGQFNDDNVNAVALELDEQLEAALTKAAA